MDRFDFHYQLAFSKFVFLLILGISFFSQTSFAQSKFSGGAMVTFGQGQMGNGSDVPDRAMVSTPISLYGGMNFKKFRVGINYENNMSGQSADPATIPGKQNLSGKGTAIGVRLEYYDGKQSAGLVYRLSDTYALNQPTASGGSSTYSGGGGITVQYTRQISKRIGFVLEYTTETFSSSVPAPSAAVKWTRMGAGIVFSNFSSGSGN